MTASIIPQQVEKKYGLIREVACTSNGEKNLKNMTVEGKKKYLDLMKADMALVKARFRNNWPQGSDLEVTYKKYPVEGIQTWRFKHGETYEVPLGLVNDINERCKITLHKTGKDGKAITMTEQQQEFIPVTFTSG